MALTYAEKLRDPRWQDLRFKVLDRDGRRCVRCGCGTPVVALHVHHLIYHREPWDSPMEELQTLCEEHHAEAEAEKIVVGLAMGIKDRREAILEICSTWVLCHACGKLKAPHEIEGRNGKHEPICGKCCMEMEAHDA